MNLFNRPIIIMISQREGGGGMELKGVKVLITGGTSGIGLAAVQALVREEAKIIMVARDERKLKEMKEKYRIADTYTCELADAEHILKVSEQIINNHPDLQVLINNAGIQYNLHFDAAESTPDRIEQEIRVNFLAPLLLIRTLLPLLRKQREAAILNVTTGLALAPKTSSAVYCGTKGGLRLFSQGLRNQLEGTKIRVIEVLPPVVDTPMTAGRGRNKLSPDRVAKEIVKALRGRKDEVYISITRLLYWLMRLSPALARKIMKKLG
jgi:uncharacterized oxidoreductase